VDACTVTSYREAHLLYQAGVDADQLRSFALADAGIDFPEDGLYCLRPVREAMGEGAAALVAATLEGWRQASDHRDEAVAAVMHRVQAQKVLTNETHMRFMLAKILETILPGPGADWQPGVLSRPAYERTRDWLLRLEMIRGAPSYEEFLR
jgi:NitT/TauT family transport system substrate-binding protein